MLARGWLRRARMVLDRLPEPTAAAISGELSARASNGQVCCYQLRACEQLHAFDRASRWLTPIRAYAAGVALTLSFCRSHHAKILIWRGDWVEAEAELTAAIVELGGPAPVYLPLLRGLLGELRRRQGRIEEAEALLVHAEGVPQGARAAAAVRRRDRGRGALRVVAAAPGRAVG